MSDIRPPDYVYPITGVQTGGVCPRKEIDEFVKDIKQFILFTRAMQILSQRPKDDPLSFFQLAGIHGAPFDQTWPPYGGPPSQVNGSNYPGYYCYHSGPLFLTWRRPYVLAFEQALHDICMQLIDINHPSYLLSIITDPVRLGQWRTAAETFRLPYWDFALRRPNNRVNGKNYCCIPDITMAEMFLSELLPQNSNPFYAFGFPDGNSGLPNVDRVPMSIQTRTVRHAPLYNPGDPASVEAWKNGTSNHDSLKSFFRVQTSTWRSDLLDLLINTVTYGGFTTGEVGDGNITTSNLNAVHRSVHNYTGGFRTKMGNMYSLPASAFDPIFPMWNCNVDRLGAMWQAANPGAWMDSTSDQKPLLPFRYSNNENDFWTSWRARKVQDYGYTYPDLDLIHDRESLKTVATNLYSDLVPISRGFVLSAAEELVIDEIVVTAAYETHEVGPFYLDITLTLDGQIEEITTIVNFVSSLESESPKCEESRQNHHSVTTSTLISAKLRELYEEGKLKSLGPGFAANIEEKLTEHLNWKCYSLSEKTINKEFTSDEFKSLKVGVSKRVPQQPSDGGPRGAPLFGEPELDGGFRSVPLRGVTDGKQFGLHKGEDFES